MSSNSFDMRERKRATTEEMLCKERGGAENLTNINLFNYIQDFSDFFLSLAGSRERGEGLYKKKKEGNNCFIYFVSKKRF